VFYRFNKVKERVIDEWKGEDSHLAAITALGTLTNHSKFILNIYEVQHNGFPFRMNLGVVDFTTSAALILLN
jgi:hypothetical protein